MKRLAKWVGLLGAALLLLSLVLVNVGLNTGLLTRLINSAQDDLQIEIDSGWSIWPGSVSATGLRLLGHDSHLEWVLTASHATAQIRLLQLPQMVFSMAHATADGVSFRARATRMLPELCRTGSLGLPVLGGLADPPTESALVKTCSMQAETGKPPQFTDPATLWRVVLSEVVGRDIQEVWVEKAHFRGRAGVEGGFDLQPALRLMVDSSTLDIQHGRLDLGALAVVRSMVIRTRLRLGPVSFEKGKESSMLAGLSLSSTVAAELSGVGFMNSLLSKAPWLSLSGGAGQLAGRLELAAGQLAVGTQLALSTGNLSATVLENVATGSGELRLRVVPNPKGPLGDLQVRLARYRLRRVGKHQDEIRGNGLSLALQSADLDLARPFSAFTASFDLGQASIPALSVYNGYLPRDLGLSILSGSATVAAKLSFVESRIEDGRLELAGSELSFGYAPAGHAPLRLLAKLGMVVHFAKAELKQNAFGIPGSTLQLRNVVLLDAAPSATEAQPHSDAAPGWWADLKLTRAELRPGRSPYFEASATAALRDLQPLLSIYAVKAEVPGWIQRLLKAEGAKGSFDLTLGEDRVSLDHFLVEGRGLRAEALLHLQGGQPNGAILLSRDPLVIGLELSPGRTSVHLLNASNDFYQRVQQERLQWSASERDPPAPKPSVKPAVKPTDADRRRRERHPAPALHPRPRQIRSTD